MISGLVPWAIFGIIHSALAADSFKSRFPLKGRKYRIFYNIIASVTLFGVVLAIPPPDLSAKAISTFRAALSAIFALLGVIFGALGLRAWDLSGFLGLTEEDGSLQTGGIYAVSRHPVYSSALFFLLALNIFSISPANLALLFGAGGYFVIGSFPEEKKLEKAFSEYSNYKQYVGRFFPWKSVHIANIRR